MPAEQATRIVATAAVVSPWWLPYVMDLSAAAAVLLPILGVLWLLFQIIHKLIQIVKPDKAS